MTLRRVIISVLTAALALAAAVPLCVGAVRAGHSGWEWASPLPQGHTINALAFGGDAGYAVGDFGTVLKTTDAGATWSGLATGTTGALDRVAVIDADSVVVAGGCTARRSDDGGATFRRLPWWPSDSACPAPIAALAFPTDQRGYVVLVDGAVWRTDDAGATWTGLAGAPVPGATDAAFTSPDAGVIATSAGFIFRTTDAGRSWAPASLAPHGLRGVDFLGTQIGFAVGEGATVLETLDGGATWIERSSDAPLTLTSIRCATVLVCLATTDTGDRLLRTTDGGKTFKAIPSSGDILTAAFAAGSRAVAAGTTGATIVSADLGATWTPVGGRLSGSLTVLRATSATLAFAAGRAGAVARTRDGGRNWQPLAPASTEDLTDLSFADADHGYALDLFGRVLRTEDGGSTWRRVRTGFPARPQAVLALSRARVLLIGPHSILRSSSAGATFTRARSRAARRAKLFEVDRGGKAVFAYGSRRIAVSTNRGRSWKTVRRPRRALLAAVDFVTSRVGFLLEQDGRLWRTRNQGRTWHLLRGTGTDNGIGLSFSSRSRGYLVLSRFGSRPGGYLLRTSDGGRTWRPQLLTGTPLDPDSVAARGASDFALAGDGSLFHTTSGGDAGLPSTVTLSAHLRTRGAPGTIRLTGTVNGAAPGSGVLVSRRFRGESGWDHKLAPVTPSGAFTSSWRLTRTSTFVAQWIGDDDQAGDGSAPLTLKLRR